MPILPRLDIDAIRHRLREGRSTSLRRRRSIAVLAAVAAVDFAVISLYQVGVIRHLPDPPGWLFDSDRVNASHKAYASGVPDGPLGLTLYGLTLALAAAGGDRRSGRHPMLDLLLAAAVGVGVAGALGYAWDMARHQARACPYCLVGAAASLGMLPFAVPEATAALRRLRTADPIAAPLAVR